VKGVWDDGVFDEDLKRNDAEGSFVRSFKHDRAASSGLLNLEPASGAEAPAVAGFEAGKAELRHRGREIVAELTGDAEEFLSNNAADGVDPEVVRSRLTAAGAVETSHRLAPADLKGLA
jgi:hypothetical protein